MNPCIEPDCDRPRRAQGRCGKHYQAARAHGVLATIQPQGRTALERFYAYLDTHDPAQCWRWQGATDKDGYGVFSPSGKGTVRVHRWAYEQLVGPIPDGLVLDHLCEQRDCANPQHTRPTTNRNNVLRSATSPSAVNARKAECHQGHALAGDNLTVNANGARLCRICERERWQRSNEKRKVPADAH